MESFDRSQYSVLGQALTQASALAPAIEHIGERTAVAAICAVCIVYKGLNAFLN